MDSLEQQSPNTSWRPRHHNHLGALLKHICQRKPGLHSWSLWNSVNWIPSVMTLIKNMFSIQLKERQKCIRKTRSEGGFWGGSRARMCCPPCSLLAPKLRAALGVFWVQRLTGLRSLEGKLVAITHSNITTAGQDTLHAF